ncbi:MAG: putative acetyltransferase [Gammaproteobacteria bacterium]|jgi:putative acetyltransferase
MFLNEKLHLHQIQPDDSGIASLITSSYEFMALLYPAESNHSLSIADKKATNCFFIGAFYEDKAVGCGAVQIFDNMDFGEFKMVYVAEDFRRLGISRKIMRQLEDHIVSQDIHIARMETGNKQSETFGLYSDLGYVECGPFGKYSADPNSVFMEKYFGT